MKNQPTKQSKSILLIFYSFSGQTSNLTRNLISALEAEGHSIYKERLIPEKTLRFPTSSYLACIQMMITTFFRKRVAIEPISQACREQYDLIILAGPTWSYNPSGPILSLLDRDGRDLFKSKTILPLISCRGYWLMHFIGLRNLLENCGGRVPNCLIFSHPNKEPWRTIGVFLKIAGKNPERSPFWSKYYTRFGHSRKQQLEATKFGTLIGKALTNDSSLENIDFRTPTALP